MSAEPGARLARVALGIALSVLASTCGGGLPAPPRPANPAPSSPAPSASADAAPPPRDPLAEPPPAGIAADARFPKIEHRRLRNGLELFIVERHSLPAVELRLVVRSGSASDGSQPGLAARTARLLKDGGTRAWSSRELVERVESLGSRLVITGDRDSTRLALSVTSEHADDAIALLGAVAVVPRFAPAEHAKLTLRELERVESLGRTSGSWAASMLLGRELFELPTSQHPYSHDDALPDEIRRISLGDCRLWHATHFVPENAFLVVAGDIAPDAAEAAASRAFGDWQGTAPPQPSFTDPKPPGELALWLVDRPKSTQADVFVATLGVERRSDDWPALRAAVQILGGETTGRLFVDVREARSLAYATGARLLATRHGPVPVVLHAGTATARAGLAIDALLEHFTKLGQAPPSDDEAARAIGRLRNAFLIQMETPSALADMTAELGVLGLPDDWYDEHRRKLGELDAAEIGRVAATCFRPGHAVVVVAGDATRLSGPLSRFGDVRVVDASGGFTERSRVRRDPNAPLELAREPGT